MRYIEYKRLCQGREKNRMTIKGKTLFYCCLISLFLWWALFCLFSCHSSHYSQRFTGHVTDPPINLMMELPSIKIIKPVGRKVARKPKERKGKYITPQYKRKTNYYKK